MLHIGYLDVSHFTVETVPDGPAGASRPDAEHAGAELLLEHPPPSADHLSKSAVH